MASLIVTHSGQKGEGAGDKGQGTRDKGQGTRDKGTRDKENYARVSVQAAAPKTSRFAATTGDAPINRP